MIALPAPSLGHSSPAASIRPYAVSLIAALALTGCLSSKMKGQLRKVVGDCPPYQEQVAFSNYEPAKAVAQGPKNEKFGLAKGQLKELGKSKYLDKMFDGVKSDFEESGVKLREIERGFEAVGLKLEKVVGPDGKTKELRISMDGTIGFELGKSRLTPIAKELIAKVAKAMKAYPETNAKLGGHVDCCAARAYNLRLSQARSDSARDELVKAHGVAASRILESIGYADDRMLIPVRHLEPRNRRVEIVIVTD